MLPTFSQEAYTTEMILEQGLENSKRLFKY